MTRSGGNPSGNGEAPRGPGGPARVVLVLGWLSEVASLIADRARARLLALRGARVGPKVRIGPRCRIEKPWRVSLGERTQLEADVYVKVTSPTAELRVGEFAFVGRGTEIDVSCEIVIGRHALIAPGCFVTDHSHRYADRTLRIDQQGCGEAKVRIGDDSWLGVGTVVLPGVTVGDGAVVGAHAVVRRDVPGCEVHAGVPARKVGERR